MRKPGSFGSAPRQAAGYQVVTGLIDSACQSGVKYAVSRIGDPRLPWPIDVATSTSCQNFIAKAAIPVCLKI